MSSETERRIKALEKRMFGVAKPCAEHSSMRILQDPTDEQIETVLAELENCPTCRGTPIVVAVPNFARLRERTR